MFSTLRAGYNSLQASTQPQSATSTIDKLCERLLNSQQREDRRAALLALKGLSRDWKSEVGTQALPILLGVLEDDAAEDTEMAKAVVETLSLLCEVEEVDGRPVRDDSGLRNSDVFLATPTALHTLLTLLTPSHFYLRFFTLQLLGILLANRPQQVQQYVLTAAGGIGKLVETLNDSREIIRNESLLLLIALTTQNADIQKLMAFEGAFDKLFGIVRSEGGIGAGGIVVQDCLAAVAGLLRWNVSNQNYFRETTCIPMLAPLLLFPRPNALSPQSLATFAFQSWSEQKVINAGLVISIVRMLVGGAGGSGRSQNQEALLKTGLTRCLIEMALASNAPAILKAQSLNALADIMRSSPENQAMLTSLIITPLIPPAAPSSAESYAQEGDETVDGQQRHSVDTDRSENGVEHERPTSTRWRRGESVPAVVAVTNLSVNGDGTPGREGLRVRAAAANLFTSYVAGSTETQLGVLSTMLAPPPDAEHTLSSGSVILHALRSFPSTARNDVFDSYVPFFACLLFSHLIMHSEVCKEVARKIYFQGGETSPGGMGDEDDRTTLVAVLVGNLMMAQREQAQSVNAGLGPERVLEWSRIMVGYLTALSVWMWESPGTVKEFLSEGSNLQVLIQPITQSSGVDSVVQGLCTYLLGVCYEYNREPGPISRETLHPILQSRVGPDQFVSRILRLREDPRFRNVGPNVLELIDEDDALAEDLGEENGLWFDFSFVEFLKTNYISVQRSILIDPHASSGMTQSVSGISPEVLAALRASLAAQTRELDELRDALRSLQQEREQERLAVEGEFASMSDTILSLRQQLEAAQAAKEEADREQEDLLVLLDDLNEKRKHDKQRLRAAALEVSDDEDAPDSGNEVEEEEALDLGGNGAQEDAPQISERDTMEGEQDHREVASQMKAHDDEVPAPTQEESSPQEPSAAAEEDHSPTAADEQTGEHRVDAGDVSDDDPYRPRPSTTPPLPEEAHASSARDGVYGDSSALFGETAADFASPAFASEAATDYTPDVTQSAYAPTSAYEPAAHTVAALDDILSTADKPAEPPSSSAADSPEAPHEQTSSGTTDGAEQRPTTAVSQPSETIDVDEAQNAPTFSAPPERSQTPQQAPPPPKTMNALRATPRRPPREREGRELIEPHVVDEEDFRPKSAGPTGVPPPPRSSAPPPPRASVAPPPRSTAKSTPRRAFFSEMQPAAPSSAAPPAPAPGVANTSAGSPPTVEHTEEAKQQGDRPRTGQSQPEITSAAEESFPRAPPSSASQASLPFSDGQSLQPSTTNVTDQSTTPKEPPPPEPLVIAASSALSETTSENRRTSIDDRLAAAFGGGDAFNAGDESSLFTAPSRDVSALFGGAVSAASRTASSLFGAPLPARETLEGIASVPKDAHSNGRERLASPPPRKADASPSNSSPQRSAASLFGGAASAATSLFSGLGADDGRQPPSAPRHTPPASPPKSTTRTRPESQDVSSLFGGAGDTASLFGGANTQHPDVASIFGQNSSTSASDPSAPYGGHSNAGWRRDQKPAQSDVRDVSSLFG
ncbi:hypothetical protein JCM10908_001559 [Rhodotorula pacifica]|uniref:uncharacterized protein n=1 Tax=Rhodotorula pacifica TaxID=1495444 RepID=UPI0031817717